MFCGVIDLKKIKYICVYGCVIFFNDVCSYCIRLDEYIYIVINML